MEEYKLKDGTNILAVRTEHNVSLRTFAVALSNYFYSNSMPFNEKLTKKDGEKILRRSLFHYGTQGEYEDGYFEASFEEGEKYKEISDSAYEWVRKKHPWLNNKI